MDADDRALITTRAEQVGNWTLKSIAAGAATSVYAATAPIARKPGRGVQQVGVLPGRPPTASAPTPWIENEAPATGT